MADVFAEFRKLLAADESPRNLHAVTALVLRVAGGPSRSNPDWFPLLPRGEHPPEGKNAPVWLLATLPGLIDEHLERLPDDQYSLLMDSLLLLFHQVLFNPTKQERRSVLQTLRQYSRWLPRQTDQFHTSGMIEWEQGNYSAASDNFRAGLAATHADEHDFMTRVQVLWTMMMERRRYKMAFDLLMDIYPRASREDLDEVQILLRETFEEAQRPFPRHKATA